MGGAQGAHRGGGEGEVAGRPLPLWAPRSLALQSVGQCGRPTPTPHPHPTDGGDRPSEAGGADAADEDGEDSEGLQVRGAPCPSPAPAPSTLPDALLPDLLPPPVRPLLPLLRGRRDPDRIKKQKEAAKRLKSLKLGVR